MKLMLVDLSHIFWTTWHATAGQQVDTAFQVTIERVARMRDGFDAVAICCDIGPSWRKDLYPEYKAGRPERDPAAYDQLRRVREQLEADGLPVLAVESFEADDIIATLAARAAGHGYETTIASGDKDLLQLVGGPVVVQSTNPGGTMMAELQVKEKFGVTPGQLGDFLALVGDKSDNIQGAPGVGPKHASRLLGEFGSLSNMLEATAGITPPSVRESIVANREQVLLARKLVALRYDVPIDFAESVKPRERKTLPAAAEVCPPDGEDVVNEDSGPSQTESPPSQAREEMGRPPEPVTKGNEELSASTAIVLDRQSPEWALALEPRGPRQLGWFAAKLAESQLYRKFPNPEAIMAVILRGRSMGIDMMTALDGFHVIEGKPVASAMLIIGCVINSGKAEFFELLEHDNTHAVWHTRRRGSKVTQKMAFSVDDARRIGLDKPTRSGAKSNWDKYPGPMCRKQAGVELARAVYPDVVSNVYSPDEMGGSIDE